MGNAESGEPEYHDIVLTGEASLRVMLGNLAISLIFVLPRSNRRWPASFCVNASVANCSASMASEIIFAHLWVAAVSASRVRRVCNPPFTLSGKQFLPGPGQRARQPARRGAYSKLFTYLFWAAVAV